MCQIYSSSAIKRYIVAIFWSRTVWCIDMIYGYLIRFELFIIIVDILDVMSIFSWLSINIPWIRQEALEYTFWTYCMDHPLESSGYIHIIQFLTFIPGTPYPNQPKRFIDPSAFICLLQVGIQIKLSDNLISSLLQDVEVQVTQVI